MTRSIIEEPYKEAYYNLEDIRLMKIGENFSIAPYDFVWFSQVPDDKIFPIIANTERIRKFLPGLNFSDEKKSKETLKAFVLSPELGMGFTYILRLENIPIGLICVHSPIYNNNDFGTNIHKNIWTVDFFISEMYEGNGIMFQSLCRVLNQLKGMGVPRIYALVDDTNTRCLQFIQNLFDEIEDCNIKNQYTNQAAHIFVAELSLISFQRR